MFYQPNKNIDFDLDIPPVCTSQPKQGSAFCDSHAEVAEKLGVPSSLRTFLKHCGVQGARLNSGNQNPICLCIGEEYSKEKSKSVESVLKMMHSEAKKMKHIEDADLESTNTPSYEQGDTIKYDGAVLTSKPLIISGTLMTLRPREGLLNVKKLTRSQDYEPTCNKDTTGNTKPPNSMNECKLCYR